MSSPKVTGKREQFANQSPQPATESTPSDEDEDEPALAPPTPPIVLPPKDSSFQITVEDPVVVKREEHARRIGYTVSTV